MADSSTEKDERAPLDPFEGNRPLTTSDLPALAEYVKQANAPKRSTTKKASTAKKGRKS